MRTRRDVDMGVPIPKKKVCILGATGCIGFELTVHLLEVGCRVLAVVRDTDKFRRMLSAQGIYPDLEGLSVVELDLFAEKAIADPSVAQELMAWDYIFNTASKPVSWVPWSRANREWGGVVSSLTRELMEVASQDRRKPHIVAFCGTEYFAGYDANVSFFQQALPKVLNKIVAALRDNHDEAMLLLTSGYGRWSVFRCGSIQPSSGQPGDASRIGMDLHKDGSDYRLGKGKSLVVEDLASYLANAIQSGAFSDFEGEMPFLFNTSF